MKKFSIILFLLFTFLESSAAKPDSLSVYDRTFANKSAIENGFFSLVYTNPAMKYAMHSYTLNEIHAGWEYNKEDKASIAQNGNGRSRGFIDVNAFIQKGKSSLWGDARYMNGKRHGRKFSETSDFLVVYPYVMGDTVGGNVKAEQYYFAGGYSYRAGVMTYGVEGSYCANIEYRNADPRPKNLTGDLNISLGISGKFNSIYTLGAAVHFRKYKQSNDLQFYNETGVPNIYHFTGLGSDYYRFRGAKGNSFYKGHSFGGSLNLLPAKARAKGFEATVRYDNFSLEKVIASLNELPMASVNEQNVKGEFAWRSSSSDIHKWGVKAAAMYTKRVGSENIFGEPSGNIFPQISSEEKYLNRIAAGAISGAYEYSINPDVRVSLLPEINYCDVKTKYVIPGREMDITRIGGSLDFKIIAKCKKWLIQGEIGGLYNASTNHKLHLGAENTQEQVLLNRPVHSNFAALSSDLSGFHAAVRTDFSWHTRYAVFIEVKYDYKHDTRPSTGNYVTGCLGFAF